MHNVSRVLSGHGEGHRRLTVWICPEPGGFRITLRLRGKAAIYSNRGEHRWAQRCATGISGNNSAGSLGAALETAWEPRYPWLPAPPPKSESSASKIFRHSGMTLVFKTTFEVFTRVGPDNSLERLTERSVGLVTDRPSDVYELSVTPL